MDIKTIASTNTSFNADCIDFCPIEPFEHIFVVGTYELVNNSEKCETIDESTSENTGQRVGCLYLYSIECNKLKILQEIELPGVLDVRWCPHKIYGKIILGLVHAKGDIVIFSLENGNHLKEYSSTVISKSLPLYLDWSTVLSPDNTPKITISDSDGCINFFEIKEKDISFIYKFKAHQFEAWVSSFNYWNTNIVYTGGDDSKFNGYDMRTNIQTFSSKAHTAGVTAIQHSLWKDHLLFSGCYDGNLLSWDSRNMKHPLSKHDLGGGVWRLRSEPFCKPLMLASTMHNGFHILEIDKNDASKIIGTYSKHGSLAYGADWSRVERGPNYLIGSVSFYDKMLSLWKATL